MTAKLIKRYPDGRRDVRLDCGHRAELPKGMRAPKACILCRVQDDTIGQMVRMFVR